MAEPGPSREPSDNEEEVTLNVTDESLFGVCYLLILICFVHDFGSGTAHPADIITKGFFVQIVYIFSSIGLEIEHICRTPATQNK